MVAVNGILSTNALAMPDSQIIIIYVAQKLPPVRLIAIDDNTLMMVHQEVSIPKGSSLASNAYIGMVNGIEVTKNLMVDPSNSTKNVIHFMLPKPAVMQIAEQVNKNGQGAASNGLMEFTLAPSINQTSSSMADMQA
jgi:hypothetical protein